MLLSVGSYCGADGVDDWDEARWRREVERSNPIGNCCQLFR